MTRTLAALALALAAGLAAAQDAPAPPDDPAALRARIAALEAQARTDAETIAGLRAQARDFETIRGRILNQTQRINQLEGDLDAARRDADASRRAERQAESRISEANRRASAEADARRRAEADARRARSDVSRLRAEARRCR